MASNSKYDKCVPGTWYRLWINPSTQTSKRCYVTPKYFTLFVTGFKYFSYVHEGKIVYSRQKSRFKPIHIVQIQRLGYEKIAAEIRGCHESALTELPNKPSHDIAGP